MRKKTGWIWLVLGAALSLTAGLFTYKTISVAQGMGPSRPTAESVAVLVVTHNVPARALIKGKDVTVKEMPSSVVPKDAVKSKEEAVGKIARVPLIAGEILLSERLVSPTATGKDVAFTMPENYVVVAIPANDLISQSDILSPGDKVDILVSLDTGQNSVGANMVTLNALQNVAIQGILVGKLSEPGNTGSKKNSKATSRLAFPKGLLVAVSPQDALVLKYFKDSGGIFDLAIRAPTNSKASQTAPVDLEYLMDRYQVELSQPRTISPTVFPNGRTVQPNQKNGGK